MSLEILEGEQFTPEHIAARLGRPSASASNRIMTPAQCKPSAQRHDYAAELIVERVLGIPHDQLDGYNLPWLEHGKETEAEARDAFTFLTGKVVREIACGIRDGVVASPDGLIGDDNGLELKCPKPTTHVKWLLAGGLPTDHKCQVHASMIVFNRPKWTFMSYAPDFPPLIVEVERDEFTEKLALCIGKFLVELDEKFAQIKGMTTL